MSPDLRVCKKCGVEKPLTEFHFNRKVSGQTRWRFHSCKVCRNAAKRMKPQDRGYHLRTTFGLTLEAYEAMLRGQGGKCAICGKLPSATRALAVDHEHSTGRIRGLLCAACNMGLGQFQEDTTLLLKAAEYLA